MHLPKRKRRKEKKKEKEEFVLDALKLHLYIMPRHLDEESPLLERNSEDGDISRYHLDFEEDDQRNPRAWSRSKKFLNVAIVANMSLLSPLSSSIFMPGIEQIAECLHVDQTQVVAASTGFVIMLGLGPLLLAPLSETFGRKVVYISSIAIFTLLQIPTALAPNVGVLITVRALTGFFGSVGIANGGGTINDMFPPSERATIYGWYLLGPMLGPVLGPLFGGLIVQRLGWRWIYWVLTILSSCSALVAIFFAAETYAPVLLAKEKEKLEKDPHSDTIYSYEGQDERPLKQKVFVSLRRPVIIFFQPIVIALSCYQALIFSITYTIYTQLQDIFAQDPYNFDTEHVGLLYLPFGVGSLATVFLLVPQIDVVYNKLGARNKGTALPEYRLPLTNVGAVLVPISLFWFAWSVHYRLHWAVPISAIFVYGVAQVMVLNTTQNYLIDAFSKYAASAIAAGSVLRSLFGGLSPLLASKMFDEIGYGWGFTVFAFISVLIAPSPLLLYFYGARLRERFPVSF